MDTSEKNVKMCEYAKEIQRQWNSENGDYVLDPADEEAIVWFWYPLKEYREYIWLPRQDQRQEICINFYM